AVALSNLNVSLRGNSLEQNGDLFQSFWRRSAHAVLSESTFPCRASACVCVNSFSDSEAIHLIFPEFPAMFSFPVTPFPRVAPPEKLSRPE
ncbi:hypothetical protein GWI33_009680, partial [Rhynchophorus ferrugineus]